MKKYVLIGFLIFLGLEIATRIVIDPYYNYNVNSYIIDKTGFSIKRVYFPDKTDHIDYLFIGSSRMPASIDINEIRKFNDTLVVVNAGKGFITGSVHYWGLKHLLKNNPHILQNAKVVIEAEGGMNFIEGFDKGRYEIDEYAPQNLIPYLNLKVFVEFLLHSESKIQVKLQLAKLYCSALYRGIPFVRSKLREKIYEIIYPNEEIGLIAAEGGIKTDAKSIEEARHIVSGFAKERIEKEKDLSPITEEDLDNSVMGHIHDLIAENGGRLILLDMPLHSVQRSVFKTNYNIENRITFENWANDRNIPILILSDFNYSDADFPDYGHLKLSRRKEFTNKVMDRLSTI